MADWTKARLLHDEGLFEEPSMSLAILTLGSNVADRKNFLSQALMRITFANKITLISDVYETFGAYEKRDPYLNLCVEVETDMTSSQFILFLQETERQVADGKVVHEFKSALDLDLIAFDNEVVRTPQLTIPHPEAHRRAFVMIPLSQIKPQWIHPILNKTAEELAKSAYWSGWGTFYAPGKSLLDF
jgi:2-amino-4-hydroxy-6-hydroxymethyldihydropteridine diphosphokinase